ncbi:MAG: sulfur oxidation c-type cytochrome SoxA [Thiotrichales bacterium]|nr:MAG: sulfur oxidation c-type cytochrome SoxA [Thiotrichales bacterium]
MNNKLLTTTLFLSLATGSMTATANDAKTVNPEADRQAMIKYMMDMHGSNKIDGKPITLDDFGHGALIFSDDAYQQFKSVEEFPPYVEHIDEGKKLWNKPFANGKTYNTCAGLNGDLKKVKAMYPYFDDARGEVINLEQAINECRTAIGEKPYAYAGRDKELSDLLTYLADESRGQKISVKIDSPGALEAYKLGEMVFHTRRGQLNQSCANCHVSSAGRKIRSEILSPTLGHVTHFPAYRASAGNIVTLQQRYVGCIESVRGFPFPANGKEFKALELYESYMSNGLTLNGPAYRK